ncbi:MAG: type II toxin-antitoxin system VapC family toxin [Candidatus Nanopelagicales bacterium]
MTNELQVYWDSCCWIGLINQEERWFGDLQSIFESAQRGDAQLWISTITILEVVKVPSEDGMPRPWPDANIAQVDNLFLQDYVRTVQLDQQIARKAREIYRSTPSLGLRKQMDAIHLATALFHSVDEFHTDDGEDLLSLDRTLPCRDGRLLRICKPKDSLLTAQGRLQL